MRLSKLFVGLRGVSRRRHLGPAPSGSSFHDIGVTLMGRC
jgi:hypothetical protein